MLIIDNGGPCIVVSDNYEWWSLMVDNIGQYWTILVHSSAWEWFTVHSISINTSAVFMATSIGLLMVDEMDHQTPSEATPRSRLRTQDLEGIGFVKAIQLPTAELGHGMAAIHVERMVTCKAQGDQQCFKFEGNHNFSGCCCTANPLIVHRIHAVHLQKWEVQQSSNCRLQNGSHLG